MVEELEKDLELSREELEKKYGKIPKKVPVAPETHGKEEAIGGSLEEDSEVKDYEISN